MIARQFLARKYQMTRRRSFSLSGISVVVLGSACALLAQPPGGGRGFRPGGEFGGFGGGGLPNFAEKTITGAPFSANLTSQSVQTLANGNQIQRQETGEVARDSQGRVYVQTTTTRPGASGNQTISSITIYDPVAGYIYRLNPQRMTAVQLSIRPRPSPPTNASPPRNSSQVQTQNLSPQTINGVTASGTQVTRTIPAETVGNTQPIQIVRVTWISTALQIPVQITRTDPRTGTSSMNLTNIVQSEPNASLFTVPSGYTLSSAAARGRRAFPR
jgi:hypothetical protein